MATSFFGNTMNQINDRVSSAQARFAGLDARLQSTGLGGAIRTGTLESFGWHFEKGFGEPGDFKQSWKGQGTNMGFLGLKDTLPGFRQQVMSPVLGGPSGYSSTMGQKSSLTAMPSSMNKTSLLKAAARNPRRTMGAGASLVGKSAMRGVGLAFTAAMAYEGYQKEGVWGAAKGVGESIAWSAGMRMAGALLGTTFTVGMVAATVGAGVYALGEAGRSHAKRLKDIEMGGGEQIMSALSTHGAATQRQRAVMALNNTHLNGRMAMGNEAAIMHTPYL